jgi:hypothetical protein
MIVVHKIIKKRLNFIFPMALNRLINGDDKLTKKAEAEKR